MGLFLSRLAGALQGLVVGTENRRVVMLGLDSAGKTTVLYKLKLNETVSTIPTIGFNVETVEPIKGVSFTVWDVGGQEKIRALWRHYYTNTEGLIFVIDSADRERFGEAREELEAILEHSEMTGVPFVVLANKQDLPGAVGPYDLIKALQLKDIRNHLWHVQGSNAVTGDGIYEGINQLAVLMKEAHKSRRG